MQINNEPSGSTGKNKILLNILGPPNFYRKVSIFIVWHFVDVVSCDRTCNALYLKREKQRERLIYLCMNYVQCLPTKLLWKHWWILVHNILQSFTGPFYCPTFVNTVMVTTHWGHQRPLLWHRFLYWRHSSCSLSEANFGSLLSMFPFTFKWASQSSTRGRRLFLREAINCSASFLNWAAVLLCEMNQRETAAHRKSSPLPPRLQRRPD